MAKVAVVILNWNGKTLLENFLPSVVRYSSLNDGDIVEIVVADNSSTDDSVSFMKANYPQVRCLELSSNLGYAEGYNKALQDVDADIFVLLNSDVEVSEGWLSSLIEYMNLHPEIAAAQPKILAQRNKSYFEYAGASGGFIDKFGYPFCRGRVFGEVEQDNAQYDNIRDVFWASGAALFIRSKDFFDVGGFDRTFFAHMEEIDMCWRLNARGRKIVCFPQSVVYHVGGATLAEESPRKTFLNFRNNILMLYKNMETSDFRRIYKIRRFLDYLAAVKYLIEGKRKNSKAVFDAHKEFNRIRKNYNTQRDVNLAKTTTHELTGIYNGSILKNFYLKGFKIFANFNL